MFFFSYVFFFRKIENFWKSKEKNTEKITIDWGHILPKKKHRTSMFFFCYVFFSKIEIFLKPPEKYRKNYPWFRWCLWVKKHLFWPKNLIFWPFLGYLKKVHFFWKIEKIRKKGVKIKFFERKKVFWGPQYAPNQW